jgi:hypothetical protein
MASVDPNCITDLEVVGIGFSVRELKSSSRKDIAKTLEAVGNQKSILELVELLSSCAIKYVASWSRSEQLTQDSLEDALDVKDFIELLRAILMNGILSVEDKKKSESQRSSSDGSSAIDALESATKTESKTPLSVQCAGVPDAMNAQTVTLSSNAQESFAQPSMMKSI